MACITLLINAKVNDMATLNVTLICLNTGNLLNLPLNNLKSMHLVSSYSKFCILARDIRYDFPVILGQAPLFAWSRLYKTCLFYRRKQERFRGFTRLGFEPPTLLSSIHSTRRACEVIIMQRRTWQGHTLCWDSNRRPSYLRSQMQDISCMYHNPSKWNKIYAYSALLWPSTAPRIFNKQG